MAMVRDRKISSSSSSSSNFTYDVFLSFNGKDIRKTFVDHLYTALLGAGLSTFRDDDEIDRRENITSEVETAISRSKSSIIVFSKDYASSTWCLDELVLILQRKVTSGLIVLPIFYDIDPSSIRRQTGRVSQAFDRHEERFKTEADDREREYWMNKVKEWSTALTEVANLRGMVLQNEADGELNFIKKVVTVILDKVTANDLNVTPYLVGLDDRVKNIRAAEVEKVSITVQHCIRALSSILTHVTMRETEDKLALELQRCIDSLRSLEKLILPDHSSLAAFPMFHGGVAIRTSPTSNQADWMETNIEVPKGTSARSDDSKSLSLIGKGKLEEASSLEELKQIVKALEQITEVLNRMKDFLLLILSYPMKPEANVDFGFLCSTFSQINGHVRGLEAKIDHQSEHKLGNLLVYREILEHFLVAAELLVKCNFDFLAYLPRDFLSAPPQVIYNLATSSAISQASKYVKDGTFNRIGISGTGGTNVIDGLKNLPEIRSLFNVVLCISISEHHNDIEIEREIVQQINLCKTSIGGTENSLLLVKVLLLLDCIDESVNLYNLHTPDELIMGFPIQLQTVLTTRSHKAYQIMPVDLEIRIEDHLLPWDLFCRNVGQVMANSPIFQHITVQFIEKCNRHLLAIILLGRSLKGINDVSIWDITLCELTKLGPQVEGTNEVMIFVLKFIWDRKDRIAQHCIKKYCTSQPKGTKCNKALLMDHWIADRVIENRQQGEVVLEDLIDSFLLENLDGDSVRMREEIRDVLLVYIPQPNALHLNLGGLKLTETPKVEEWDAKEINLMNNKFSELPDNPKCPVLAKLSLQSNYELTEIPQMFFESMPVLQVLDISNTSIKSLNVPSISRLVELQVLLLKSCELLMELPPQIGALTNLKVLDVEGTELVYLPKELGELINLECLKVSLYGSADSYSESKEIDEIIPRATLSKLTQLKELSINVDPDGEWWNFEVKTIFEELPSLSKLENLKLYLPTTELLQQFLQLEWNMNGLPIYPNLVNFRLIVGPRKHRVVSRIPLNLEEEFLELEKCMKFINGEGSTNQFGEALKHVNALFLDCHWTIEKLSVVKIEYLNELKVCLLVDCNEMKTIFEGHDFYQGGSFGSLQYLGIHYLKNLEFIWKGPIFGICLPLLQILALHMCPNLTTIFTPMLLQNLVNLEEITVEDCPKVKTLVVLDLSNFGKSDQFLPRLKKISLLDLPELINISNGLHIAPKLERMFIFNCPKLKILYPTELCNKSIIEIKGESEWWNALEWREPEWSSGLPDYLHHAFSPLAIDVGDLMDQLAISGTSLKTLYVRSKSFARARVPTFQAKGIRKVSNDLEISPEEFPLGCYKSTSQDAEKLDKGVNEQSPLCLDLSLRRSPLPNQSPNFKKMVLKLEIHNDKEKQKAMKAVSHLSGIESIAMDMKNKKLTVIGDVDPIAVVYKLRKLCHAELLTIGPANEPEKKDEKKDVDKKKDQNDIQDLIETYHYKNYNPHMTSPYVVHRVEAIVYTERKSIVMVLDFDENWQYNYR